ncbi:MAG: FAD-dependent oxidoreductase [Deltaproteobacteria bacterium]|nr:FAD-dependent oxidoreductase [Deltaproteobacteria bacterium]
MARPVVVIGAGIAGLAAAHALQKRGVPVEVIERESAPGGRMRSEHLAGGIVDRGAQFIANTYGNMHALARELGIDNRIEPLHQPRNGVLKNGRIVGSDYERLSDFVRSRDLSLASKLRLPKFFYHIYRHRGLLDFYHLEQAAALDGESAAAYVRRAFGDEVLDYLIEPAFASTFTVLPENLSKAFLLAALKLFLGGFHLQAFHGGNGLLTRTLAEQLPVRLGTEVTRVEPRLHSVMLRLRQDGHEASLEADRVIMAVPGNAVARLCRDLTPPEEAFFAAVRYAASIIVFVMTATTDSDPGLYGVGISRPEGVQLYGLAFENVKAGAVPPGKTLFNCALSEERAAQLMTAADDVIVAAALRELRQLPLRGLDRVEQCAVHRWPALVPQFYPGYHRALARFYARPERSERVFFAGDYLVGPYTEAALTSGLRAAEAIAPST